jgi:hypothetical protein
VIRPSTSGSSRRTGLHADFDPARRSSAGLDAAHRCQRLPGAPPAHLQADLGKEYLGPFRGDAIDFKVQGGALDARWSTAMPQLAVGNGAP